jgi:hypothetical protein
MLGRALEIEHVERVLQESLPEQDLNIVRATAARSYDNAGQDSTQKLVLRLRLPDPEEANED